MSKLLLSQWWQRGWRLSSCCPHHVDTKKTPGVLLWNGARKKTLLCGIDHLIHEIEKKSILLKKPLQPIDPGFDLGNMVVVKVIVISTLNFWWQFFCYFVKLFFEIFWEINMFFQVMVCFSAQNSPKKNVCTHTHLVQRQFPKSKPKITSLCLHICLHIYIDVYRI